MRSQELRKKVKTILAQTSLHKFFRRVIKANFVSRRPTRPRKEPNAWLVRTNTS